MEEKKGYKTQQREVIKEYLVSQGQKHITIEQVSDFLRERGSKVGRTTIYRYMEKLTEQGTLRKYFIEEGVGACYEWVEESKECGTHFHLKCAKCGTLFHVECNYLTDLEEHIKIHHGFIIDNRKTVLYGICESCREKEDREVL